MSEAIEIASTYVSVGISTEGLGAAIASDKGGIGRAFAGVGKRSGAAFKGAFQSESAGATKSAEKDQESLARAAQAAVGKVKTARDAEAAAARKVTIEEQKLKEARESGAKGSQILAAEDRLANARTKHALATARTTGEVGKLKTAQTQLRASSEQAADAAEKSGSRIGRAFGGKIGNPFSRLPGQAKTAGDQAGDNVASGVSSKARTGLARLNPFGGLKSKADEAGRESGGSIVSGITGKVRGGVGAIGSTLKFGLIGVAAGAGAAVGAAFTSSISAASKLEQSIGGVGAVFKQQASVIDSASKGAATSVGLTRNAYNELATTLGAGLKNKGIQDFTGETQKLIGLGSDLAAQFGGSTQEAVEAISSLMRGEADPIEKYGVAINETAINAELAARGQDKLKGAALEQAKAQARLKILFDQTKDAQGAFGRESDTFAGKQQRAAAQWEDLKAKIGGAFLPVLSSAMGYLSSTALPAMDAFGKGVQGVISIFKDGDFKGADMTFGLEEDSPVVDILFRMRDAFISLRDSSGPVLAQIGSALQGVATTVAANLFPILQQVGNLFTTVVLPALTSLWQSIQLYVVPAFMGLISKVQEIFAVVGPIIAQVVGTIVGKFQELSPQINAAMTQVGQIIGGVMNVISSVVGGVLTVIRWLWSMWGDNIMSIVRIAIDTVWGVIQAGLNIVQGVIRTVMALIRGDWAGAWEGIKQIFVGFWDTIGVILGGALALVWQAIQMAWESVKSQFVALGNFLTGVWNGLWNGIYGFLMVKWLEIRMTVERGKQFLEAIFDVIGATLSRIWTGMWDGIKRVGSDAMDLVKRGIDGGLGAVRGFFESAVQGIGRIWDGLKGVAAAPVRFVIDTVLNNGLIKGWNDLIGLLKLPGNLRVDPIRVPGFAQGTDRVPGSRSRGTDSTLAVTSAGTPIARVDPGEGIVRYASMRKLDRTSPGAFEHINRYGTLPGFFLGGRMPTSGPVNRHGGYGWARWAGDIPAPAGQQVVSWMDGMVAAVKHWGHSYGNHVIVNHANGTQAYYAHLSRTLAQVGQQVRAGDLLGLVGSTGKSTGNHLHFEIRGGSAPIDASDTGGGGGGMLDMVTSWITNKLGAPVRALIDRIPGAGLFVEAAKGMGSRMLDGVTEKIRSLIPTDFLSGSPSMSGVGADSRGSIMGPLISMMKGRGLPRQVALIAGITAMQEASGRQPGNGDGGGYHVPGLFDKRWQSMSPGQAAQAVQVSNFPYAYDKHIPYVNRMLDAHGYWRGTDSAQSGWALVGERGRELVHMGGGETVLNNTNTEKLLAGDGPSITYAPVLVNADEDRQYEDFSWRLMNDVKLGLGGR